MTAARAAKQIGQELGRNDAKGDARLAVDLAKSDQPEFGPWEVSLDNSTATIPNSIIIKSVGEPWVPVCVVARPMGSPNGAKKAERLAHLIAAAPELLEACRFKDVDRLKFGANDHDSGIVNVRMTIGELRRIRAAIAKATGGAA